MSSQNKELDIFLEEIGEEYAKHHYPLKSPKALDEEVLLGGTKDTTIKINVKNGHGSASSSATTAWVTIDGYFMIEAPSDGTWHIVAKVDGSTVFDKSGVKKGTKMSFHKKTSWKTKLGVTADWSEKKDTSLQVKVHASY